MDDAGVAGADLEASFQQIPRRHTVPAYHLVHAEMALTLGGSPAPITDHLEVIQKSALRSADLTRQLLAFARKQTIAPKVVDLKISSAAC